MSGSASNIHPAVALASGPDAAHILSAPALVQQGTAMQPRALSTPSSPTSGALNPIPLGSPTALRTPAGSRDAPSIVPFAQSLTEGTARTRAREVLQTFIKERQRVTELEQQLTQSQAAASQLAALGSDLRKEVMSIKGNRDAIVASAQQEQFVYFNNIARLSQQMEHISMTATRKINELVQQLQGRETEVLHYEEVIAALRKENELLRREAAWEMGLGGRQSLSECADASGAAPPDAGTILQHRRRYDTELARQQEKVVVLTRKLIEAEQAKRQAEEALRDDRNHYYTSLATIEKLREQLNDSQKRLESEAEQRAKDIDYYKTLLSSQVAEGATARRVFDEVMKMRVDGSLYQATEVRFSVGQGGNASCADESVLMLPYSNIPCDTDLSKLGRPSGKVATTASLAVMEERLRANEATISLLKESNERKQKELAAALEESAARSQKDSNSLIDLTAQARRLTDENADLKSRLQKAQHDRKEALRMLNGLRYLYEDNLSKMVALGSRMAGSTGEGLLSQDARSVAGINDSLTQLREDASDPFYVKRELYRIMNLLRELIILASSAADDDGGGDGGNKSYADEVRERLQMASASFAEGEQSQLADMQRQLEQQRIYHNKEIAVYKEALAKIQSERIISAGLSLPVGAPQPDAPAPSPRAADANETGSSEWKIAFMQSEMEKRRLQEQLEKLSGRAGSQVGAGAASGASPATAGEGLVVPVATVELRSLMDEVTALTARRKTDQSTILRLETENRLLQEQVRQLELKQNEPTRDAWRRAERTREECVREMQYIINAIQSTVKIQRERFSALSAAGEPAAASPNGRRSERVLDKALALSSAAAKPPLSSPYSALLSDHSAPQSAIRSSPRALAGLSPLQQAACAEEMALSLLSDAGARGAKFVERISKEPFGPAAPEDINNSNSNNNNNSRNSRRGAALNATPYTSTSINTNNRSDPQSPNRKQAPDGGFDFGDFVNSVKFD